MGQRSAHSTTVFLSRVFALKRMQLLTGVCFRDDAGRFASSAEQRGMTRCLILDHLLAGLIFDEEPASPAVGSAGSGVFAGFFPGICE